MVQKEYRVLGHKVAYTVTENSVEFNALDKSRPDAANDEAVANIVYRGMNPDTRYWFLHGISQEEIDALKAKGSNAIAGTPEPWVGVEDDSEIPRKSEAVKAKDGSTRMKDGVEVTKYIESEEVFYNRVLATLVETKKYASEDAARAHYDPVIKRLASYVAFDIVKPEATERGPKKLAAKFKIAAAKVLANGTLEKVNSNQLANISKTFTATDDTSKMFSGEYPVKAADGTVTNVAFNVSEKDAETLGWLIKEYMTWKEQQTIQAEF